MAEGVAQIEQGAASSLFFILGDDFGLHGNAAGNRFGQGIRFPRQNRRRMDL